MNPSASSMTELSAVFGADGLLSEAIPDFHPRERQAEMAAVIARAIDTHESVLIEAGTGTGKTFAYLVPLLFAGVRSIVSTGSRTLQDQLFYRDLPRLASLFGLGLKFAVLKGRGNYLCPLRLGKHLDSTDAGVPGSRQSELVNIRQWQSRTTTGDLGEILDLEASANLIPLVTSTADNCLGNECPKVGECPVYRARALAAEADIVVVNHHLLMADLALQDDNIASLLPAAEVIVLDEAHQVPQIARQFAGNRISSGQFIELARDVTTEALLFGGEEFQLIEAARALHTATDNLSRAFADLGATDISVLQDEQALGVIGLCESALATLIDALAPAETRSRLLANCYQRGLRLMDEFALLTEPMVADDAYAHWFGTTARGFSIHLAPVSIADDFAARVHSGAQSWILTSATLAVGGEFDYIRSQLGLVQESAWRFESPFDFLTQVRGYIPADLPVPGTEEHTLAFVDLAFELIDACKGRTFMLFTSYRALELAARCLAEMGVPCVVQGQDSRAAVLERFGRIPGCVLLGTHSFWEGVDVRGAGLSLLMIDKLPFAAPDEPLMRARIRAAIMQGKNGFMEVQVPEATIALRQGFGRLIRDENDVGLFVLGDNRVLTKQYGKMLLSSLPQMDWLRSRSAAVEFLESL